LAIQYFYFIYNLEKVFKEDNLVMEAFQHLGQRIKLRTKGEGFWNVKFQFTNKVWQVGVCNNSVFEHWTVDLLFGVLSKHEAAVSNSGGKKFGDPVVAAVVIAPVVIAPAVLITPHKAPKPFEERSSSGKRSIIRDVVDGILIDSRVSQEDLCSVVKALHVRLSGPEEKSMDGACCSALAAHIDSIPVGEAFGISKHLTVMRDDTAVIYHELYSGSLYKY
jgi:hypothetical protein